VLAAAWGATLVSSAPAWGSATVLRDGSPTRLRTPGTLRDLALDQDILLRFEKEGREPREVTVRLTKQSASKSISVDLPPEQVRPGGLEIVTEPPGAVVVLDGRPLEGVTPLTLSEVASGVEHLIRVSLEGYQEEAATVKVEPGETAPVKLALKAVPALEPLPAPAPEPRGKRAKREKQTGEVVLTSMPAADILLGGKNLGRTPATVTLPVGKVSLTFVNAELELRQTVSVNVEAKGTTRSAITFKKGKLAADATPWADVYIGNRKLGTTPLAPREVYEGSYTLRLVNSELGAIKTLKVVVAPGKTTVVRERME
jgi:eukaryotic-like serine/threonine-protein kinase